MAELKLAFNHLAGFPYIKAEGDLTINGFAAIHMVVKGATKFGTIPVIVDFSGVLDIADDIKEIKCWRSPTEIPDYARSVVLSVISSVERLDEIKELLMPHQLRHAVSLQEAINLLGKTSEEAP